MADVPEHTTNSEEHAVDTPKPKKVAVFVKDAIGKTHHVPVALDGTVEDLVLAFSEQSDSPEAIRGGYRFIHAGTQLHFNQTLESYCIQQHSTIHAILRLRGS